MDEILVLSLYILCLVLYLSLSFSLSVCLYSALSLCLSPFLHLSPSLSLFLSSSLHLLCLSPFLHLSPSLSLFLSSSLHPSLSLHLSLPCLSQSGEASPFPGGDDSFQFISQMVHQYVKEEETRARHQAALLQLRERALKEKTKAQLDWLRMKRMCV